MSYDPTAKDEVRAAREALAEPRPHRFDCPDCGVGVPADEDGCCAKCGRDAVVRGGLLDRLDWIPDDLAGAVTAVRESASQIAMEILRARDEGPRPDSSSRLQKPSSTVPSPTSGLGVGCDGNRAREDCCGECGLLNDDHHYAVGRGTICPESE